MFSALSVAGLKSGAVGKPNFDFGHFRASLFGQKYDLLKSVRILAYTSLRFKYFFVPESRLLMVRDTWSNFDFQNKNRFHGVFRLVIFCNAYIFCIFQVLGAMRWFWVQTRASFFETRSQIGPEPTQRQPTLAKRRLQVGSKLVQSQPKLVFLSHLYILFE